MLFMTIPALPAWPYPFWIAHRGAGKLAPENTLAAFRLGASHGWRMFECDAKLSRDGVLFLLHDDRLERTSNGQGIAGQQPWAALSRLDAGAWHSRQYAGEPLLTLERLAHWCLANHLLLNLEIKPSPDTDADTGQAVAQAVARLWQGQGVAPLLSSFSTTALQAARMAAPALPRALLLDTLPADWLTQAQALGCIALVAEHALWTSETVGAAKAAGLRTLSYTVNETAEADRLRTLGTDGIITDRVDFFSPAA
jgi:glycerophosphoryl diester phosphodiesterase